MKHKNNSGKPAFNRGKPPHKGGYHAANGDDKKVTPNKVWFEKSVDTVSSRGESIIIQKKVSSNWRP